MDINGGSSTTLPPEITDSQVTNGFGATPVLVTPTKLKTFTGLHSCVCNPYHSTVLINISLRGLDICWENTITEIQGFFIYGAVGTIEQGN
jgi:hypothetical protein